ncbi:methyltransferase [Nocardiopsis sp. TSRI0078]|uniref:methyltransferase n=1 Tax=unclassified Nocardiopsis TaxID=2649073 RepID=UPI00093B0AB7|nr:methyltransferase [Nocardiopsis sp. TSRI0078]OKI23650.1 methyltransferase [Nocardiopsis sp. TSRI0078]
MKPHTGLEEELHALADLATPMAIRVAATLRLADHIGEGTDTTEQIADATSTDSGTLDRLLRHLCSVGVLRRLEPCRYAITEKGDCLRDDHPSGLRARLDTEGAEGHADLSLLELGHSVRTGEPAFDKRYGAPFWEHLAEDPELADGFHQRMGAAVQREAEAIATSYDWSSLDRVVDVGGGDGTLLTALLRAHPRLRGTVLDLPGTAERARNVLAGAGVADRSEFVAGSFFDPLPTGADGYVLSAIIHNWGDTESVTLLRRCAEAAGECGRVFVIERIGPDGTAASTGTDLRMIAYFGGRERDEVEISDLADLSGLRKVARHPASACTILEFAPNRPRPNHVGDK